MKAAPIVLAAGCGRAYECGPMRAVFKADEAETSGAYSVSEWAVAPTVRDRVPTRTKRTMRSSSSRRVPWRCKSATNGLRHPRGTFLRIPAGVIHDFENRTDQPATLFNVFIRVDLST